MNGINILKEEIRGKKEVSSIELVLEGRYSSFI